MDLTVEFLKKLAKIHDIKNISSMRKDALRAELLKIPELKLEPLWIQWFQRQKKSLEMRQKFIIELQQKKRRGLEFSPGDLVPVRLLCRVRDPRNPENTNPSSLGCRAIVTGVGQWAIFIELKETTKDHGPFASPHEVFSKKALSLYWKRCRWEAQYETISGLKVICILD